MVSYKSATFLPQSKRPHQDRIVMLCTSITEPDYVCLPSVHRTLDEFWIYMNTDHRRVYVWQCRRERISPAYVLESQSRSMRYDFRSPLVVIWGPWQHSATSVTCCVCMRPLLRQHQGAAFHQDNAHPHTARVYWLHAKWISWQDIKHRCLSHEAVAGISQTVDLLGFSRTTVSGVTYLILNYYFSTLKKKKCTFLHVLEHCLNWNASTVLGCVALRSA